MARAVDDFELVYGLMGKPGHGPIVQIQDHGIVTADDKQGWGFYSLKSGPGEVRSTAARNDGLHGFGTVGRGD